MGKSTDLTDFTNISSKDPVHTLPNINGNSFNEYWFDEIEKRNLEENHPERNDPSHSWPIGRFEPHQLGNCKRKWFYRWLNAPEEERDPHGIFAIGHYIEEEVIEPWLRHLLEPEFVIDNAVHVSHDVVTKPVSEYDTVEGENDLVADIPFNQADDTQPIQDADDVTITVAGSTDPVILSSEDEDVIALTEVKSTGKLGRVTSPKRMHLLQVHAYLSALDIDNAFVIYVDRNKLLDPKVFEVEFDSDTWATVEQWVLDTVEYAISGELPPANPPEGWMCNYCEYRNRCGKGRSNLAEDMGARGFVPGLTEYPLNKVRNHLEAHDDVLLTPSLALEYPELTDEYDVDRWKCPECTAEFDYIDSAFNNFQNGQYNTPECPSCASVFNQDVHLTTHTAFENTETQETE